MPELRLWWVPGPWPAPPGPPWTRAGEEGAGVQRLRTDGAGATAGACGSRVGTPAGALPLGLLVPHRAHLTIHCAATSGLRDRKAPKDRDYPCLPPKDRCHLSHSLMAATVRLSWSWQALGRHRPPFTIFYRRHPHKKI